MLETINNNYYGLISLMILIIITGFILIIISLFQKKKNKDDLEINPNNKEINKNENDIEQLNKEIFTLYKKVEVAKSKFDYDTLKDLLTETLYEQEEKNLKQLKETKQKLVATNIKLQEIKLLSITKKNEIEDIDIYLHVSQYDYIIDNKKKVIRGTDEDEYQIEYKITLEKNKDKYFKIKKLQCTGKWIKNK